MVLDAQKMENSPARVLIIDTAWLGDVLFTTSLIGAVREAWAQAEIHLVTAPRAQELVQHHPELSSVRIFDKHGKEGGVLALKKLAADLNSIKFDIVLCAHPSMRSRMLCAMLDAPIRVGHPGLLSSRAFTKVVRNDLSVQPDHVERRLNLLRAIVPVDHTPPLKVGLSPDDVLWARQRFAEYGADSASTLALIPGSARKTKQWDIANFNELAKRWLQHHANNRVLVFLGPSEVSLKSEIDVAGDVRSVIVEESLRKCAALLSMCSVAVGNDTGVSFLAIAAGCEKVLVLYGCTQVNYTFPMPHKAIAAGVPCCLPRSGHGEKMCRWTVGPPWCMNQITVDRIAGEIIKK